jgi:hypothetical protein
MASNDLIQFNSGATALTLTDIASANVAGPTKLMADVKPGTLSALCVVDAETNLITLAAAWEVSNDASTWYSAVNPTNTAPTVLATGTGGADATVSKVVSAPDAVYSARYARCSIAVATATGTSNDTATVGYCYVIDTTG